MPDSTAQPDPLLGAPPDALQPISYIDLEAERLADRRPVLDVSKLPPSDVDPRATVWWGNNLLLLIETAMFGILIAAYLYYRNVDFAQWPPPEVHKIPPDFDPNPKLLGSTVEMGLMLLSLIPAIITDRACFAMKHRTVRIGLVIVILFELLSIALRFHGFKELHFRWDDNAYGSVTWGILFLHLLHLLISCGETVLLAVWLFLKGLDPKHARNLHVSLLYWYWVVGIWVPLYLLVYWGSRFF